MAVGEDDPQGDEKSFALTRQSRIIPLDATQPITSLASATRGGEAWKTLLQCFRTPTFLALSDASSAKLAAEICGQVERLKEFWSMNESGQRGGVRLLGGTLTATRGGVGTSKSWSLRREFLFQPTEFLGLDNFQAIVQPFDGSRSSRARRVYPKPAFLPADLPHWTARERGLI